MGHGFFSPYELAELRALSESGMGALCTIKRGGAPLSPQPTMPNGAPLRCQVSDAKADQQITGADPTQKMRKIKISLPWNCPVQALDQVTAEGIVYGVIEDPVHTSPNFNAKTVVYAYALYALDPQGNPGPPLYLRCNAVVNVTRNGVAVPNTHPTSVQIMPAGVMNLNVQGVPFTTDIEAPPGTSALPTSWQINDVMSLSNAPAFQVQQYTVISAEPPYPLDPLPRWKIRVEGYLR